MIGVKIEHDQIKGRGKDIMRRQRPAAYFSTLQLLFEVREEMEKEMRRPKHGRLYRKKNGRIHQASAPGEAPAIDTGKFLNSLYIVRPKWKNWQCAGHVASRIKYAPWLEYGTSKMAPRPVFRVAMRRVRRRKLAKTTTLRVFK